MGVPVAAWLRVLIPVLWWRRVANSDQDGDLDVALLEYPCCGDVKETKVHLFVNRGSASAPVLDGGAPDMSVEVEGTAFMLDVVDLNTDGLLDLVYGSSSGIHVYMHAPPPHKVPPSQALPFLVRGPPPHAQCCVGCVTRGVAVVPRTCPPLRLWWWEGPAPSRAWNMAKPRSCQPFMTWMATATWTCLSATRTARRSACGSSVTRARWVGLYVMRAMVMLPQPRTRLTTACVRPHLQSFVPDPRLPCGDLCNRTWGTPRLVAVNADADAEAELLVLDEDGRMHWFDRQPSRNFVEAPGLQAWTRHLHIDPRLRYVMVDMTNDGTRGRRGVLAVHLRASPPRVPNQQGVLMRWGWPWVLPRRSWCLQMPARTRSRGC